MRDGSPVAVLSCVHANLEALRAVLADIDRRGVTDVICLGDVVGYGPDPEACVDLVRARCRVVLRGCNDEDLLAGRHSARGPNLREKVLAWTHERMAPGQGASSEARARWSFLDALPVRHDEFPGRTFVHGAPHDHREFMTALPSPELRAAAFAAFERLAFVGHTHEPGLLTEDAPDWRPPAAIGHRWVQPGRGKALVNVGAVGQPRDRDPRACYVTAVGGVVEWHRVEYDVERVRDAMRRAGFSEVLGERLALGL